MGRGIPPIHMIKFIILLLVFLVVLLLLLYWYYRLYLYSWYNNLPRPKFKLSVDRDQMVAMPDGTKLATDVYRPKTTDKYPVIVIRTPYNKSAPQPYRHLARLLASQGYVIVVQDVRGKYGSEGEFYPYAYEALDGHTTVDWAGESLWSNGRVGLFGMAYPGSCAWLAARYKSPYLRTLITMFTTQNTYAMWVQKGIPFFKSPLTWLTKHCTRTENVEIKDQTLEPMLWQLPLNMIDEAISHTKIPFYREYLAHTQPDSFWEEISGHHGQGQLDIPALIVGGWYDPYLNDTIEDYQRMGPSSRLQIAPHHSDIKSIYTAILEWCDLWLKDKKTEASPKVRYFLMGRNEWREADQWPPSGVKEERFFLSVGRLSLTPPEESQAQSYTYNPRDPVLFRGSEGWLAPIDQVEMTSREDVLIYSTEPLEHELTLTGIPKLILYVSSQALDTDFCVKICDMYPSGSTYSLTSGFVRMRFRDSLDKPETLVPGQIYRVEITFRSVSHAFLKNHRLQLYITSSDFPIHDRNLNTGMSSEASVEIKEAVQTIYMGKSQESYLVLPILVLPNLEEEKV